MKDAAADNSFPRYERPNQPWICGKADHGDACPTGPLAHGRCPGLGECAPTRDGDRWQCNRSALRGGPCDEGPQPNGTCGRIHKCRPVRSLRSKRGRFIAACTLLAVGGMLIALSADWRNLAIRPGPLARQHAQILENPADDAACGACHAAATQNVAGWAVSAIALGSGQPTQMQLCMNCHSKSITKELAHTAHNLPTETLSQITHTSSASKPPLVRELGCSACHREHHGAMADLTALDNHACQTCHQQRYRSLAADHPDFGNWPYKRRTPIVFNHATHQTKHFIEKKQPFDCQSCHRIDPAGNVEQLASYEKTCAACHDESIATSIGPGLSMFAVPTIDVDAIRTVGRNIDDWPAAAIGDFDGKLPPAMKLLLAADPAAARAMTLLGADFEFQDVSPDDVDQVTASADIAKAIRSFVTDLREGGPHVVRSRLSTVLGREVTAAEAATLTAGLSNDTHAIAAAWWPAPTGAAPKPGGAAALTALTSTTGSYGPVGSWSCDEETLSVRYRPAVHADPVLASWLNVLANTPQFESRPLAAAVFKELTKATAPGLCTSCHSIEQRSSEALTINWRAADRTAEPRGFTRFSHGPHLVLPQLANCGACHSIDNAANTATSYASVNLQQFVSEFKPVSKQLCTQCHTATAAGDRCQTCHRYHVQRAESWRLGKASGELSGQASRLRNFDVDLRVGTHPAQFATPGTGAAPKREVR